ncbi:MAG: HEPN domain-containing protein [Acidobacteriia bacterium]|nr:HEPN domain-containing protein [Terriglobia bacterium]
MLHLPRGSSVNRAADWLGQAELDLKAAIDSAATGHHEWAAFQAQQCAEKAVEALVQSLHGSARGHSVFGFLTQVTNRIAIPEAVLQAAQKLDLVYMNSRYPNGFDRGKPADYFSAESSQELIGHARTVLEFCRSQIH